MAFGLKEFKKQAKEESQRAPIFYQSLVLGSDLWAVKKLCELIKAHGPERVKLISERPLTKADLKRDFEDMVSLFRGDFPELQGQKTGQAFFYKDGQLRSFDSKAKPVTFLSGEDYFQGPAVYPSAESFFTQDDWDQLDQILTEHVEVKICESISSASNEDLVDIIHWRLSFFDFGVMNVGQLYTSLGSSKVLKLFKEGDGVSDEVSDKLSECESIPCLNVSWELSEPLGENASTYFLPQSLTHEWGHFILETFHTEVIFLRDDEPTAEVMGQKLKLAKRVIERVFSGFEKSIKNESIQYLDNYFYLNTSDKKEFDNFTFLMTH